MDERLELVEDGYEVQDPALVLLHQQMRSCHVSYRILDSQNWGISQLYFLIVCTIVI